MTNPSEDIKDICSEFGVDEGFVRFAWAVLQEADRHAKIAPLHSPNFVPRTIREMALGIAVALRRDKKLRKSLKKLK